MRRDGPPAPLRERPVGGPRPRRGRARAMPPRRRLAFAARPRVARWSVKSGGGSAPEAIDPRCGPPRAPVTGERSVTRMGPSACRSLDAGDQGPVRMYAKGSACTCPVHMYAKGSTRVRERSSAHVRERQAPAQPGPQAALQTGDGPRAEAGPPARDLRFGVSAAARFDTRRRRRCGPEKPSESVAPPGRPTARTSLGADPSAASGAAGSTGGAKGRRAGETVAAAVAAAAAAATSSRCERRGGGRGGAGAVIRWEALLGESPGILSREGWGV